MIYNTVLVINYHCLNKYNIFGYLFKNTCHYCQCMNHNLRITHSWVIGKYRTGISTVQNGIKFFFFSIEELLESDVFQETKLKYEFRTEIWERKTSRTLKSKTLFSSIELGSYTCISSPNKQVTAFGTVTIPKQVEKNCCPHTAAVFIHCGYVCYINKATIRIEHEAQMGNSYLFQYWWNYQHTIFRFAKLFWCLFWT